MLHGRPDYTPIQDPRGEIPVDEPVMLFRSRDQLAPLVLDAYAQLIRHHVGDDMLACDVELHANRMRAYQAKNGCDFPSTDYAEEHLPGQLEMSQHYSDLLQSCMQVGVSFPDLPNPAATDPTVLGNWPQDDLDIQVKKPLELEPGRE